MTISFKAAADGLSGTIQVGGVDAANVTNKGIPFMKNILINGNMAINQRNVTIAAAANGAYGPDRWKKVSSTEMTQIVEDGNFRPSTQYVLSGTGVTTQVLTSPASGNWTIPNIPIAATNIQLEEGSVPTPFEIRNVGLELSLCQRYYEKSSLAPLYAMKRGGSDTNPHAYVWFKVTKRVVPQMNITWGSNAGQTSTIGLDGFIGIAVADDFEAITAWQASAEL